MKKFNLSKKLAHSNQGKERRRNFISFIFLFYLNRHRLMKKAIIVSIIFLALLISWSLLTWKIDLPIFLLLFALLITTSGILLGANFVFLNTLLAILILIILTENQTQALAKIQSNWPNEIIQINEVLIYSILLFSIAIVAWLFCRKNKLVLLRAQLSEAQLRIESDLLEIKIEMQTRAFSELETEKINQLYRLAEFGRISSGIFHDLINPLTAIALNLEQIKTEVDSKILNAKSCLDQALSATNKMSGLLSSIKKQIAQESTICLFSLNQEIEQIIQILSYKARRANVNIKFISLSEIKLKGDAIKFSQIIMNLLANAIEACEEISSEEAKTKKVVINLKEQKNNIEITVDDNGQGIAINNLSKIFMPFFSTKKSSERGLGIGLASTKNIIEKNFKGQIRVISELNKGTSFIINIPNKKEGVN